MSKQTPSTSNTLVTTKCDYCKNFTVKTDQYRSSNNNANSDVERGLQSQSTFDYKTIKKSVDGLIKVPKALKTQDRRNPPNGIVDANVYSIKKSLMTLLCLIIVIMENSIQIKYVIRHGKTLFNQFYTIQLSLGIMSILLATFTAMLLMYSARINYNDEYKQRKLDFLNNIVMALLFILCIFNIFLIALN